MLVLCHRGYHKRAHENTLEAFEHAQAFGIDGIETDIQLSADGRLVLYHDRITPSGEAIADLPLGELCRIVGYRVPTLDEALDNFASLFWNLEVKAPAALMPMLDVAANFPHPERLLVTSFWHEVVVKCAQTSQLACGLLTAHRPIAVRGLFQGIKEERIRAVVWDFETLSDEVLGESTDMGLQNFVYGAKTPRDHGRLVDLGVDGVITDTPEFMVRQ